ncbi:chromodomain-helicase-DNA-binding protein, partial [Hamiltosporidium magnivora]
MTSTASTNSDQSEETSISSDSVSFHSSSSPQPSYGLPTLKKRGRPRKSQCTNPALYNSPLGYNYNPRSQYLYRQVSSYPYPYPSSMGHSNPSYYGNIFHNTPYQYNYPPMYNNTPYNTPYRFPPYYSPYPNYQIRPPPTPPTHTTTPPHHQNPTTPTPTHPQPKKYIPVSPVRGRPKRTRKSAYIPSQPPLKIQEEEEIELEQISDTSSDIEKLLSHNPSQDTYLVKYKNKSYIHCSWVSKNTILQTRSGSIKIRRFRPKNIPFDPEYLIVEKILLFEDTRCLIKWKKLSHELSTFEETEKVKNCENYTSALTEYNRRVEKAIKIKRSR